ncbi:MAG: hypothetical protein ACU0C9_13665 [Paracoccaceae bacterium]
MHLKYYAAILALLAPVAASANPLADLVRDANAKYQDVALAEADGYGAIPCVSGHAGGAMGIHYVNGGYLTGDDDAIDIARPEALMYEPQADGSLVLVGVEYLTFAGPASLEGHLFDFSGAPNRYGLDPFYSLHVWAWRENPMGTFAHMNANVSCENTALTSG